MYESYQAEIPSDARALFVEALTELRPKLWSYVPKLAQLFDFISNPSKLKTQKFKIELSADHDIRSATLDSTLLIDAFEYADINGTHTDMEGEALSPASDPSILSQSKPALKETVIEASRLGLFDDILTYFYLKKVGAQLLMRI